MRNIGPTYYLRIYNQLYCILFDSGLILEKTTDSATINLGYVDVSFSNNSSNLTTNDEFQKIIDRIPNAKNTYYQRLYHSFRSALTRKIKTDKDRISSDIPFQKIDDTTLLLTYSTDKDELEAEFLSKKFLLKKNVNTWKIDGYIEKLPSNGTITIYSGNSQEIYNLFKLENLRQVFNETTIPNSPIGRFKSIIENQQSYEKNNSSLKFSTKHKVDADQNQLLNSLLHDPLILVNSIAGTGKTTTVLNALLRLNQESRKVLVVTHNHRALEAIIENLLLLDSEIGSYMLRLCTRNTAKNVIHKQFLPENSIAHEKRMIKKDLEEEIETETNAQIKELQNKLIQIFNRSGDTDPLSLLLVQSKNLVFGTADSMLSQSYRFTNTQNSTLLPQPTDAEFDIVIIEDSSDINLPTIFHSVQFSQRWAIIGDEFQSNPVVSTSIGLPKYSEREVPHQIDKIKEVDLQEKQKELKSILHYSHKISKLLGSQGLDYLKTNEYFPGIQSPLKLHSWYRVVPNMVEFMKKCFPVLTDLQSSGKSPKNLPFSTFQILDSHQNAVTEEPYEDGGYTNYHEIDIMHKWITQKTRDISVQCVIGIYAPFSIQVNKIMEYLLNHDFTIDHDGYFVGQNQLVRLHINTLHNHKNREYDMMVISGTRSFLPSQLRNKFDIFTLFSRAIQSLLIICDYERYNTSWESYSRYLHRSGKPNQLPWEYIFYYIRDNPEDYERGGSL